MKKRFPVGDVHSNKIHLMSYLIKCLKTLESDIFKSYFQTSLIEMG